MADTDEHRSTSLGKWGLVEGWLVGSAERRVEIGASTAGLEVRVVDPERGERWVVVGASEDPSAAAWRAVVALDVGR